MGTWNSRWVSLSFLGLLLFSSIANAQLSEHYYMNSCPRVKTIVETKVNEILGRDKNMAGGIQRLHFHDCWTRGCEGSILLQSTPFFTSEREGFANFKIRGFSEIDEIKTAVENECPNTVSCADILALAARDATVNVGGPSWSVPLGRRDGTFSSDVEADENLPFPVLDFNGLVSNFAAKGFNAREMIILSGAHTIGRSHCNGAAPHFYNFTGIEDFTDPSLDAKFVSKIKQQCPKGNRDNIVNMDPTMNKFDNKFFKKVLNNRGLLTTDAALITNTEGKDVVLQMAQEDSSFFSEFGAAMEKMGRMGVLTGYEGQIRKSCQFIN